MTEVEKKFGGSRGVSIAALGGEFTISHIVQRPLDSPCDGAVMHTSHKGSFEKENQKFKNRGDLSFLSFQPPFSHPPSALGASSSPPKEVPSNHTE